MKKKLILLVLSTALILASCNSGTSEISSKEETTAAPLTTIVTTTDINTDDPQVITTVPETEDQPSTPVTTVPPVTEVIPETEDSPLTNDAPATDESPILDKGSEQKLAALLQKYPIISAPAGDFASKTLSQLIESASRSFSESKKQSITAEGVFATSLPLVGEVSHQALALSLLTDGTDYLLTSKITEKDKVIDDSQVYTNGWLYNTSTVTENGNVTETDNYKIKMSSEGFEDNVLSNTQMTMETAHALAELFVTAENIKAGMMEDGSLAVLAKGYGFDDMIKEIDPDQNLAQYMDVDSFSNMETALVIGADGNLSELYVKLPLGIKLEGIPMTMTIELAVTPAIPESVTIIVPAGGDAYVERTIEEIYGDEDDFVFDW